MERLRRGGGEGRGQRRERAAGATRGHGEGRGAAAAAAYHAIVEVLAAFSPRLDVAARRLHLVAHEEPRRRAHLLLLVVVAHVLDKDREARHHPHGGVGAVDVDVHHLAEVADVVLAALLRLRLPPRPRPLDEPRLRRDADAHHVGHLARRHERDAEEEVVQPLRRLADVGLAVRLDVDVPLHVGAHRALDQQRLLRLRRVQILLHQLDDEHLLVAGLAAHQPELRVLLRVGERREAPRPLLLVVRVARSARRAVGVPLLHLLAQPLVLLLPPLRVEAAVLGLVLPHVGRVVVGLVLQRLALVLVLVVLVLLALHLRVAVDEAQRRVVGAPPLLRLLRGHRDVVVVLGVVVLDGRLALDELAHRGIARSGGRCVSDTYAAATERAWRCRAA